MNRILLGRKAEQITQCEGQKAATHSNSEKRRPVLECVDYGRSMLSAQQLQSHNSLSLYSIVD